MHVINTREFIFALILGTLIYVIVTFDHPVLQPRYLQILLLPANRLFRQSQSTH